MAVIPSPQNPVSLNSLPSYQQPEIELPRRKKTAPSKLLRGIIAVSLVMFLTGVGLLIYLQAMG